MDAKAESVKAQILSGKINDHNTFDAPDRVKTESFDGITLNNGNLKFTIPACSVMHIKVKK